MFRVKQQIFLYLMTSVIMCPTSTNDMKRAVIEIETVTGIEIGGEVVIATNEGTVKKIGVEGADVILRNVAMMSSKTTKEVFLIRTRTCKSTMHLVQGNDF